VAACVAAVLASCGDGAGEARHELGRLVPRDASFFLSAEIDPESAEGREAGAFLERFAGERRPLGEALARWFEVEGAGFSFREDVARWIGGEGAMFFARMPDDPAAVGMLAEARDEGVAESRLRDLLAIGARAAGTAGGRCGSIATAPPSPCTTGSRRWRRRSGCCGG
jgi:hypothetical protein